ncbi:MAG TPA: hypothetical protein VL400_17005 [Polyangiaceae bacterium]|nr:hypothetical protein [Polyangiaceae bacterium]
MRLLKSTSPESDPEAFMRLRAAYELIERAGASGMSAEEPRADGPPTVETPPLRAAPTSDASEPAPAAATDEPPRPWEQPVERGDRKAAAELLVEWLDAAKREPGAPRPPLGVAVGVMLELIAKRQLKSAGSLRAAIDDYVGAVGAGNGWPSAEAALTWSVADGVWTSRHVTPPPVLTAMAEAVAKGEPSHAAPVLRSFAAHHSRAARVFARDLRRRAPIVLEVFGPWLAVAEERAPPPPVPPRARPSSYRWAWAIIPLMSLLRFLATSPSPSAPRVPPPTRLPPIATSYSGDGEMDAILTSVRAAVRAGDCSSASVEWRRAVDLTNDRTRELTASTERSFVDTKRDLEKTCGPIWAPLPTTPSP